MSRFIRDFQRVGTIGSSGLLIILFSILYAVSGSYEGTANDFPRIILAAGILFAVLLIIREIVLEWTDYEFGVDSGISEYLRGGESQYSPQKRAKRVGVLAVWTAVFFALATLNFILAITVCYPGMLYSLGIRDRKVLIGGTIVIDIFIFIVFVWALGIPLGVF